jgi:RHS repeat-associated protein
MCSPIPTPLPESRARTSVATSRKFVGDFRKASRSDVRSNLAQPQLFGGSVETCLEGPFGEVIQNTSTSPTVSNPFRFSTKYQDEETGLLYFGYRYYSANVGRWISRDPAEEAGGANTYSFVCDSPVSHWDAFGLALQGPSAPVFDYWRFIDAKTVPNWTFSATIHKRFLRCGWKVKITGSLGFTIHINRALLNFPTENGETQIQHEYHHVSLTTGDWLSLKGEVDPYEGTYDKAVCAGLAVGIANAQNTYYAAKTIQDNIRYDINVYGSKIPPAKKQEYQQALDVADRDMWRATGDIFAFLEEWEINDCK